MFFSIVHWSAHQFAQTIVSDAYSTTGQMISLYFMFVIYSGLFAFMSKFALRLLEMITFGQIQPHISINDQGKTVPLASLLVPTWFNYCLFLGVPKLFSLVWNQTMGKKISERRAYNEFKMKRDLIAKFKEGYEAGTATSAD